MFPLKYKYLLRKEFVIQFSTNSILLEPTPSGGDESGVIDFIVWLPPSGHISELLISVGTEDYQIN